MPSLVFSLRYIEVEYTNAVLILVITAHSLCVKLIQSMDTELVLSKLKKITATAPQPHRTVFKYFAIFKNVAHSLKPGQTLSNSVFLTLSPLNEIRYHSNTELWTNPKFEFEDCFREIPTFYQHFTRLPTMYNVLTYFKPW